MTVFRHGLEGLIIEHLRHGPLSAATLLEHLYVARPKTTKQGMYAVVRKLVRDEVMVKQGTMLSLNATWVSVLEAFVSSARLAYAAREFDGNISSMQDGDRLSYRLKSANATDVFWDHALQLLISALPGETFLAYDPHCWFFLARNASERALRDAVMRGGGRYLVLVGSALPLDRALRDEFDGNRSQYHMLDETPYPGREYYVNVVGDYVVEVWLDKERTAAIDALYERESSFSSHAADELRDIIHAEGRSKLVISRNRRKARVIRNLFQKYFVF